MHGPLLDARWQFATGWYGGGNQRRFEAMAVAGGHPLGVLAVIDGEPVGWCACGPRSRYTAGIGGRSNLLADSSREEDDQVWLIACLFVRPDRRGSGLVAAMLQEAVVVARDGGATAVEAWPLALGVWNPAEAHVGREEVFADLGFSCIQRPNPERATMRLELSESV